MLYIDTLICRITKPEPLELRWHPLVAVPKGYKGLCMYSTCVCVTHTKMSEGFLCSSSIHTGCQTGTVGLPGAQDADCEHVDMEQAPLQCFPSYQHHSFLAGAMIQPATMTKLTRMQFCQANKNAIFGFKLQKMLNPSPTSSPSLLVGRKWLSSAHIHEGRFDERWPCTIKYLPWSARIILICYPTPCDGRPCATNTSLRWLLWTWQAAWQQIQAHRLSLTIGDK